MPFTADIAACGCFCCTRPCAVTRSLWSDCPHDAALDAAAWALLEQYDDKDWSLVEGASFVLMRQRGITQAFTTDQHFLQAGFVRVPSQ